MPTRRSAIVKQLPRGRPDASTFPVGLGCVPRLEDMRLELDSTAEG